MLSILGGEGPCNPRIAPVGRHVGGLCAGFPELTGRVVDDAGILDPATKDALARKLAEFETKTSGQLVVVTVKSLQGHSIVDYGYQRGRHWQIARKEKTTCA